MATTTIDRCPLTTSPSQFSQCSGPQEGGGGELLLEGFVSSRGAGGSVYLWSRASRPSEGLLCVPCI